MTWVIVLLLNLISETVSTLPVCNALVSCQIDIPVNNVRTAVSFGDRRVAFVAPGGTSVFHTYGVESVGQTMEIRLGIPQSSGEVLWKSPIYYVNDATLNSFTVNSSGLFLNQRKYSPHCHSFDFLLLSDIVAPTSTNAVSSYMGYLNGSIVYVDDQRTVTTPTASLPNVDDFVVLGDTLFALDRL